MSVVEQRTLAIPQFIVAHSTEFSLAPERAGDPQFNFLLRKRMDISDQAFDITHERRLPFELSPFIQIDINGRVMGKQAEAEGWGNIKGHLFGTEQFVRATGEIVALPYDESLRGRAGAVLHDCDTRLAKESLPREEVLDCNGNITYKVNEDALFEAEMTDEGPRDIPGLECVDPRILEIAGVTHAKWVDPENWDINKMMMRLADSSIGSIRDSKGAYVQDMLLYPEYRTQLLKVHKPRFHERGIEVYGKPTFDRLDEINAMAERKVRQSGEEQNPDLLWCYFNDNANVKTRLIDLVGDVMAGKVTPPVRYM